MQRTLSRTLFQQGWMTTYPLAAGLGPRARDLLRAALALPRHERGDPRADASRRSRRWCGATSTRARKLCERSDQPIAKIFLEAMRWRNVPLEDLERVLSTSRQEAAYELKRGLWMVGTVGSLAPVRRPVRHRGRHHPRVRRHGRARRRRLRGGGGRHLRGADRDRGRSRRRDHRAACSSTTCRRGSGGSRAPMRAPASASCRRCSFLESASRAREARRRTRRWPVASFRPDDAENPDDGVVAEINITPLTDVFLVLLVIFMVTTSVVPTRARTSICPARRSATPRRRASRSR